MHRSLCLRKSRVAHLQNKEAHLKTVVEGTDRCSMKHTRTVSNFKCRTWSQAPTLLVSMFSTKHVVEPLEACFYIEVRSGAAVSRSPFLETTKRPRYVIIHRLHPVESLLQASPAFAAYT